MKKIFIIILLLVAVRGFAQINRADSGRTIETVDIVTVYKPDVAESVKIDISPRLEEPKADPPIFSYHFPNTSYKPKAVYSSIDPVFLKPGREDPLFDNYIELGAGNYLTTFLDASIHNTRDRYYSYGLRLKHHAAGRSKNPNQALFSENRITAFGMREKGSKLKGEIDYRRNVVHYYGYLNPSPIQPELEDINQIYNDISARGSWEKENSQLQSGLDFDFNIFDKLGATEGTLMLNNNNRIKTNTGYLNLDLGLAFTQIQQDSNYSRIFFDLKPNYEFHYQKWDINLGINVNYFNDSNTNRLYFTPKAHAQTYLVPDKVKAYVGVDGGLQKNTLRSMSYMNMFTGNQTDFRNPFEAFKVYLGMNAKFKRFVEYGIQMSHSLMRDQFLFVNDSNRLRNFRTVYDSISTFTITGELKFDINENMDIGIVSSFYAYNLENQTQAWHLPTYDIKVFSAFRMAEKIYISGSYFAISSRNTLELGGREKTIAAINDINLGIEYRYRKNISAFINANNILNRRYEMWNHYRVQGINVLAGITFSL